MAKVKVFIHDELQLGMVRCAQLLSDQTYCFALDTGPGFGLFVSRKGSKPVALIKDSVWKGAVGELWEVSAYAFGHLNAWYQSRGSRPDSLFVPATGEIICWVTPIPTLRKAKMIQIRDYRETVYTPS